MVTVRREGSFSGESWLGARSRPASRILEEEVIIMLIALNIVVYILIPVTVVVIVLIALTVVTVMLLALTVVVIALIFSLLW